MSSVLNTHRMVYCSHTTNSEGRVMATGNVNNKSQIKNVRIPHDVLEEMESVKQAGESSSGFIVTAMRGEISRRQLKESGEDKLLTNLNGALVALERIGEIGTQAGEHLRELVGIAQGEALQLKGNKPDTPEE
ncbi:YlcI/YnfO family protein [Scandinavium goeteborgense]|uniref:YlcI/YnfO family protein n=1 Tax=Scandinavium goeteborgense TaxID=1851514 RepID=UPI0037FE693B